MTLSTHSRFDSPSPVRVAVRLRVLVLRTISIIGLGGQVS